MQSTKLLFISLAALISCVRLKSDFWGDMGGGIRVPPFFPDWRRTPPRAFAPPLFSEFTVRNHPHFSEFEAAKSRLTGPPKLKSTIWAASARQNGLAAAQIRAPNRQTPIYF